MRRAELKVPCASTRRMEDVGRIHPNYVNKPQEAGSIETALGVAIGLCSELMTAYEMSRLSEQPRWDQAGFPLFLLCVAAAYSWAI